MAGARHHGVAVDRALEPRDERVDARLLGLRPARRRHQAAAQLAHGGLEHLGLQRHGIGPQPFEHDAARGVGRVVALDAVGLDERPLLLAAVAEDAGAMEDEGGDTQRSCAGSAQQDGGAGHKQLFIKERANSVQPARLISRLPATGPLSAKAATWAGLTECAPVHRGPAAALYDGSMTERLMRRPFITFFAATLAFAAATAQAQGDLGGVTMRVLDDVSDIDAVVLELDANRGDDEDGAERDSREDEDAADAAADGDAAQTSDAGAEEDRLDERRDGDELHDPDVDERAEGRLEDRDVERPAAAQPTP